MPDSTIVAGVDFGTLSVRVCLYDRARGVLARTSAEYPLHRSQSDTDFATQGHEDQMDALVSATRQALKIAAIDGERVAALALDTTGSSVIVTDASLNPLCDYYLWCDHRAAAEAAEITAAAHAYNGGAGFEGIDWCGGTYSSEWGWAKLLHWLRNNRDKRAHFGTALEHCDMVAATLCGISDPAELPRSVCAMGHKWMWNPRWGGLPPEDLLLSIDPLFQGIREKISGRFATSDTLAGHLCDRWAQQLGLRAGIPIPVGGFDAHWDAVGSNIRLGDAVNVIGTSTCIIGLSTVETLVPGVCGVVPGSVYPDRIGIEAGLSAVGDIFSAIAVRAKASVRDLAEETANYVAGQTGLLRMTWDNGDRTVLVNPALGGVTFGWTLTTTAADEFFAAIEGTALHTRIILERMTDGGAQVDRIINAGGIPNKNPALNQVYANVLNKPVLVGRGDVTSLGSVIFAFVACGEFPNVEAAQNALCPPFVEYLPEGSGAQRSNALYGFFKTAYFALGSSTAAAASLGGLLPALRNLRRDALESASPIRFPI